MDRVGEKPFIEAQPARYKHFSPSYYLYLNNSRLVALDNLKRLGNDEAMPADLKTYIRKNKIGKRKEEDLKRLFFYITGNMN